MHSIRTRIIAITIITILISFLAVFFSVFSIMRDETDRNSVSVMNLIGEDTRKSLEKYFESIEQSVEVASNLAIDSLDSVYLVECGAVGTTDAAQTQAQRDALSTYLADYNARVQEFFAGVADYTHGVTAYFYCINPEICEDAPGFFYMKVGKTGYVKQKPIDVRSLAPSDNLNGTWYDTAVRRGCPTWIGPYTTSSKDNNWVCSYVVPIYKSGKLIGIMGMDIPCETLIAQIENIRVYTTGYVCLLDAQGRVIYHPDLPIGSSPDELGLSVNSTLVSKKSSGNDLIRYTASGEELQMSFCTLPNGMKLFSIAPSREINDSWFKLMRVILLVSAVLLFVSVSLILVLIHAITFPLKQLTDASRHLAEADYDVDLTYDKNNEIGTLTGAFKQMREEIRHSMDDLNHQLYYDRLTGLPNMRHFFKLAHEERKRLLIEEKQPVLAYFNLIGLSHFNRQYGFAKGDEIIKTFADILVRQFDGHPVCRFTGDQFAVVTTEDKVNEEIQAVFRECESAVDEKPLRVRVGIYPNRLEYVDVNVACDRAKYALAQSKGDLFSSISYFTDEMRKQSDIFRHINNNLDKALAEGWVKVYYQPIVRTADGKVCDEEALARWIDPVLGFLSPAYFIPALEDSKQIYKLDLYVLDQILIKMRRQAEAGFYVVPQSVNLSRMDFESCDVVEEIRRRVDDAGVNRSMITIEITESVIGGNFDFMKEQIIRFRNLGFPVWMDDFGSGYSSLDVLHQIHFDLIKFDMRFMERFDEGDESKIILTELMTMAIGLGMETVCEGVEHLEQVEFLREIGCTRIQGYYYSKPLPFEGILSLFKNGTSLEFENPGEADYYSSIGRINLYDMSAFASENDDSLRQYFNTLPMSIMEVNGTRLRFNRCNRSFRDFLLRTLGVVYSTDVIDCSDTTNRTGAVFLKAVVRCAADGNRAIVDERVDEDTTVHALIRRVAVNAVTGTSAVAVAVLAVIRGDENAETNYGQIAKALSSDYVNLYYVNLMTEQFTEYTPDAAREDLAMERHGNDFFAASHRDALDHLYSEDLDLFFRRFTKENVVDVLDKDGAFTLTYRLMMNGNPVYVNMKAVRMPGDRNHIIIGVNNVDAQVRQEEALSRIQLEKTVYSRFSALTRDYLCVYTVDPDTGHYVEYTSTSDYAGLGVPTEGDDFFAQSQMESERHIYPEDREKFQMLMTRENVLAEVEKNGFYSFNYRLILDGRPQYLSLKAALVDEPDGKKLIVGFNNIDSQVRREQEYAYKLSDARKRADLDVLTGVKNRTAYDDMSGTLDRQIEEGLSVQYAIILCSVRDISAVNETQGRAAGDQLIRDVCSIVCNTFKHSPVFRVSGDQFAVIARGHDFVYVDELVAELREKSYSGGITISCGLAKYDGTESAASVFLRAEHLCRGE